MPVQSSAKVVGSAAAASDYLQYGVALRPEKRPFSPPGSDWTLMRYTEPRNPPTTTTKALPCQNSWTHTVHAVPPKGPQVNLLLSGKHRH
ncbi:Hypothetical predicted protein [Pelobates cultripes]|uniref:Uncharacterized protein n=1 Tax=Pelobates cultripes TaxID=61616 RepID=A0AAD1W8K0_PELCU|nr:Hypothetical predicted protein [Pelobates cultripes]